MNSNTFYKHHAGGLVTLLSSPTTGISKQSGSYSEKTEEEIDASTKHHLDMNDRRREREEWS